LPEPETPLMITSRNQSLHVEPHGQR